MTKASKKLTKHKTMDDMVQRIVRSLKRMKGDVWQQYVGDVQIQHSIVFEHIEEVIDGLIKEETEKLSIFELARLFDGPHGTTGDVFKVIDKFWETENAKLQDMLNDLQFELKNCVESAIKGEIFRIAADVDMDKLN